MPQSKMGLKHVKLELSASKVFKGFKVRTIMSSVIVQTHITTLQETRHYLEELKDQKEQDSFTLPMT
jgi:hypothetical protein